MKKDLISGFDISASDIKEIFKLGDKLKKKKTSNLLKGKSVGLIFQKPSTRTRVSFEIGAKELGAECIYLSPEDIKLGQREPVKDIARVLKRYLDLIVARTFSHNHVLEFAREKELNVINGLSDLYHPCQALADLYTIYEKKKKFKGIKLAYVGDGNNVAHSLLAVSAQAGLDLNIATPRGYEPDKNIWKKACSAGKKTKAKFAHFYNPNEAVRGVDFIYTDVWASMGQESQRKKRIIAFKKFQVNSALLKKAQKDCLVMHCMPAHRNEEITDDVIESKQSIVFDQAENRLHVQKAVMALMLHKHR